MSSDTNSEIAVFDDSQIPRVMDQTVMPALSSCLQHDWTDVEDPGVWVESVSSPVHHGIHSVFIPAGLQQKNSTVTAVTTGTVLIVPGFSESWFRFAELAWYMSQWGLNVVIMENRGHGTSLRETTNPELITVHHWQNYTSDVAAVARHIRSLHHLDGPLFLYGHSMGGAICAAVVEKYPDLFARAVLSSPMLLPSMPMPTTLAWALSGLAVAVGQGDKPIPGISHRFDEAMDEEDKKSAAGQDAGSRSPHRAIWYRNHRREHLSGHILNPSWNWVHQALAMDRFIMKRSSISTIVTPTLLFGAGQDVLVRIGAEGQFVSRARELGVPITYHVFPTARHEIFTDTTPVLTVYLTTIRRFFAVRKGTVQ
jgi:lysophospholipase